MTTNAISYVFESVNNTDNNIDMDIRKTLSKNLLNPQELEDYTLSITRLAIPTTNIPQLYIPDGDISKFTVGLKMYSKYLASYVNYTKSLPNENSHGVIYHSKEKVIEMINRSLNNCYMQHFENVNIVDTNMRVVLPSTTSTFTTASPLSTNLSISSSYNKFAGIKLRVTSAITKNIGADNELMRLFIQSGGVKQYLYCGSIKNFVDKSGIGGYDITENSYRDWYEFDQRKEFNTDVKAYESYLKFKDTTFSGHLNVGIECSGNFSISFQYQVTLFLSDENTLPSQSPFIAHASNNKISLNLQNYYYKLNNLVGFSGFLNNAMDFTTVPKSTSTVNNVKMYFINYDSMLLDADLSELMILTQDHSTIEKLGNLSEIQLRSSSLSGVSENIITNASDVVSSNVLQEFVIFKDESIGNQLLYSESNVPWRRINMGKILHATRTLDFQIYASYENSYSRELQLAPGESFSLRLSFLKN